MTDIVERLRKEVGRGDDSANDGRECCYAPWTCCDPKLLSEAADVIEEQHAIRMGVMAQLKGTNDIIASLEAEIEQQRLTILDRDAVITERDATIERMAKALSAGQRGGP